MIASTPLGMFTLFFGWLMFDKLFEVLAQSGLLYLPFLIMLIRNVIEAKKSGADEGNPAWLALKRTEIDGLIMIIVLTLAVVPVQTVTLSQVEYVRDSCSKSDPALAKSTTYENAFNTLNGEIAKVPVWWGLISSIGGGVTGAAMESLPCSTNWGSTVYEVSSQKITGPALQQELSQFVRDCYAPALSAAQSQGLVTDADDVSWVGSELLLNTPELYEKNYAMTPLKNFNVRPDAHSAYDPAVEGGGRPNCKAWWEGAGGSGGMNESLRARLLANVNPDVLDSARLKLTNLFGADPTDAENGILKGIIEQSDVTGVALGGNSELTTDKQFGAKGLGAAKGLAKVGMSFGILGDSAGREAIKMTVPMVVNFILMIVIILIPVALMLGLYNVGLVFQISVALFSLYFFRFLWGIAQWMEDKLWMALTSNIHVSTTSQISNAVFGGEPTELIFVQNSLYLLVFTIYFALMGWAGFKVGEVSKAINEGSKSAASAGAKGPGVYADVAIGALSGGASGAAKAAANNL